MATQQLYQLPTVFRMRDRLLDSLAAHYHETLQGDGLLRLTRSLCRELPSRVSQDAVFESVRYLAGKELTETELARLAWRLAGNVPRLRDGLPVPPWSVQSEPEWVPLEILEADRSRDQHGNIGYTMAFRVLAGTPCPMRITAFWKMGLVRAVSEKFGFSAPWGRYPFHSGLELVGLRFFGRLDPPRCRVQPAFYEIECPASLVTWNRQTVLKLRMRIIPCPNNWTHPCRKCFVGYDQCVGAVHPATYRQGFCNGCGEPEAYFDPASPSDKCVACAEKERLRK